jgi:hypothetical protein
MRKFTLVALTVCFSLTSVSAFADEILWEKRLTSGYTVNSGVDIQTLTPASRLSGVAYYVNKSNPDALIAQIIMDQPLSDSPLSEEKKLTGGLWIFSKTPNCMAEENCDQVLQVHLPTSDSLKTNFEGLTLNPIQYGNGKLANFKASDCESPVRMIQNQSGRGIYEIVLSISCLNIPKSFYSYAYMSEDVGLSKKVFNFTNRDSADYPFYELAQKYYDSHGGFKGHNILVAAEGVNNLANRVISEAALNIVKTNAKVKKLQKQGKKSLSAKIAAKNKALQAEIKKLNSLQANFKPYDFTADLGNKAVAMISQLTIINNINIELLNLDLQSKP